MNISDVLPTASTFQVKEVSFNLGGGSKNRSSCSLTKYILLLSNYVFISLLVKVIYKQYTFSFDPPHLRRTVFLKKKRFNQTTDIRVVTDRRTSVILLLLANDLPMQFMKKDLEYEKIQEGTRKDKQRKPFRSHLVNKGNLFG